MKFLKKLENNLLTSLVVYALSILGFAITCFQLNTAFRDIPLGFLFSGGVIGSLYLLTHFLVKKDEKSGNDTLSLVSIIVRFVVIVGVMVVLGLMNYRWNIILFNLFVFVGIYSAGTIVFVLLHIFKKDRKENDA